MVFGVLIFVLGFALYLYGLLSCFGTSISSAEFSLTLLITVIGGLACLGLGYVAVILLGGIVSLRLVEFTSRFTRSKHIVEPAEKEDLTLRNRASRQIPVIAMPFLVFLLSTGLAWDIHNLHDPRTSFFHWILHELDIYAQPITSEPITYSFEIILVMIVLVVIAGIVPSLVLPFFRKFKITGVNSGPFHTDLLITVIGSVTGFGVILTLLGLIFEVMWVNQGPYYFHYVIPVMLGLSLQYTCGSLIGRTKAEEMVRKRLDAHDGKRVLKGSVNIQTH